MSSTLVSDYMLCLPDKELLQNKLRELTELALESCEGNDERILYGLRINFKTIDFNVFSSYPKGYYMNIYYFRGGFAVAVWL